MKEIERVRESRDPGKDTIIEDTSDVLSEWEKHKDTSEKKRNNRKMIRPMWP